MPSTIYLDEPEEQPKKESGNPVPTAPPVQIVLCKARDLRLGDNLVWINKKSPMGVSTAKINYLRLLGMETEVNIGIINGADEDVMEYVKLDDLVMVIEQYHGDNVS